MNRIIFITIFLLGFIFKKRFLLLFQWITKETVDNRPESSINTTAKQTSINSAKALNASELAFRQVNGDALPWQQPAQLIIQKNHPPMIEIHQKI